MYADKPMRGHGLMQAIAHVNRVFGDKQGGLIVDFLGRGDQLKQALVRLSLMRPPMTMVSLTIEQHRSSSQMVCVVSWTVEPDARAEG